MEYTDGTLKYNVISLSNKSGGVLYGVILAFSGAFDSNGYPIDKATGTADTTWHLCDGTNGTPDLRGRFILGASDAHAVGSTGGEEATGLEIENLPPHSFSGTTSTDGAHTHTVYGGDGAVDYTKIDGFDVDSRLYEANNKQTSSAGNHHHTFTTNTLGAGIAHNNMPPYYTLAFIMKI